MIPSGFNTSGTYPKITKDPGAVLPYTFDWTDWLAEADLVGESIGNSTWESSDPAVLVVDSSSTSGTKTQCVLSGGAAGKTYTVTNKIVLSPTSAYKDERSFQVTVARR